MDLTVELFNLSRNVDLRYKHSISGAQLGTSGNLGIHLLELVEELLEGDLVYLTLGRPPQAEERAIASETGCMYDKAAFDYLNTKNNNARRCQ